MKLSGSRVLLKMKIENAGIGRVRSRCLFVVVVCRVGFKMKIVDEKGCSCDKSSK